MSSVHAVRAVRAVALGDFGPGIFLTPAFLNAADADCDGQISQAEALEGLERWCAARDADHNRRLAADELRAGLNRAFAFHGPGAGPRPPAAAGPPLPR